MVSESMKTKVRFNVGESIYRPRKGQVEPAFDILEESIEVRQFILRGLTQVTVSRLSSAYGSPT